MRLPEGTIVGPYRIGAPITGFPPTASSGTT
jgi:hypothetical protein